MRNAIKAHGAPLDGKKVRETVEERTHEVGPEQLHGVAPRCKLVSLKVLNAAGKGRTSDLIRAQNSVNFAYILYLRGRAEHLPAADLVVEVEQNVAQIEVEKHASADRGVRNKLR